jgi:hypothetical protein
MENPIGTFNLSNRQITLALLMEHASRSGALMTEEQAIEIDQRTFKSFEKRGWLDKTRAGYKLNFAGRRHVEAMTHTDIRVKGAEHSWSSYWRLRQARVLKAVAA